MRSVRLLALALVLAGCDIAGLQSGNPEWQPPSEPAVAQPLPAREPCADRDPDRRALFGDLHVHTGLSMDARSRDVVNEPHDAYRYARGEEILVPPLGKDGVGTRPLRIDRPLDFAAVTDHAEYFGEVHLCTTRNSSAYDSDACRIFRGEEDSWLAWILGLKGWPAKMIGLYGRDGRNTEICGDDFKPCRKAAKSMWELTQQAAAAYQDNSAACEFTTIPAWEYSRMPERTKIHRNVFFRNAIVPELPISWIDAETEVQLWERLRERCVDTGSGCDVITIPHNPNLSNGHIFTLEYQDLPLEQQKAYAELRASLEPLVEMMQIKGESECQEGLRNVLGNDELCDFEKIRGVGAQAPENCEGNERGAGGMNLEGCVQRLDYARYAVIEGLREEQRLGVNPFRVGFVGSTDTHNAAPGAVLESAYPGTSGVMDDTPQKRLGEGPQLSMQAKDTKRNPGGLAGVWAEENSRDAIFDALKRRETFATSGPRIQPRFFGGWNLPDDLCGRADIVKQADGSGVPMGGMLPPAPTADSAPVFLASALGDPGTKQNPGGLLQRLQIIKGWYEGDTFHQAVHDVAGNAHNGASVDTDTCRVSGPGWRELCGGWRDPDFDPAQPAVYYARVIENPSCRWSAWQCLDFPAGEQPRACTDPNVPKVIQERAWTSPIWYVPAGNDLAG